MFRLLSKESNIFSIPVYIVFLLLIVISFNVLNFSGLDVLSTTITFAGCTLTYFLFNKIGLNYHTHLPLFLYTFFVFGLYPGHLDIGIAVALFINAFLLLILTSPDEVFQRNAYVLVGALLGINYIFLPTTWPMAAFAIFHIFATTGKTALNVFRLIFGLWLVFVGYFCIMFFLSHTTYNPDYLPKVTLKPMKSYYPLYLLTPVALMLVSAVANHFQHYNEKSPVSRFKYTFLLIFSLAQLVTIILYMGTRYEYLLLLAFPASIILSRFLKFLPKYWMREAGLWLIILMMFLFKIGTYIDFNAYF